MNDSVDDRISRARQRLRAANSEAERRDALLDEWRATLDAFARAREASAVSSAARVAKVRVGAQEIEPAIDELRALEHGERQAAINAMRWLDQPSQLRAVLRAARDGVDDLRWIERLGQLEDRDAAREIAVEIAGRSNVELPSLIEALHVHLGSSAAAAFASKARAAQAVIDEAGSLEEIAWVASLLLALAPDEARDTAVARSLARSSRSSARTPVTRATATRPTPRPARASCSRSRTPASRRPRWPRSRDGGTRPSGRRRASSPPRESCSARCRPRWPRAPQSTRRSTRTNERTSTRRARGSRPTSGSRSIPSLTRTRCDRWRSARRARR